MNIFEQAAMFLGEQDLPECNSIKDALNNVKVKLVSDGCEIVDDSIQTNDPSLQIKLTTGINVILTAVDTLLDPWDNSEMVQINVYYTNNLSYPDKSDIKAWYEIDAEYLETEFNK